MTRFTYPISNEITLDELKVALLNYTEAKKREQKFVVRFNDYEFKGEDTRRDVDTLELLNFVGITPDDVQYQSQNLKFHQQLATKLLMDKKAYNCFCKSDRFEACDSGCKDLPDSEVIDNENPFSVRIKGGELGDFKILNIDKSPTLDFATAIDDMLNDISAIVEDEKSKQNILRQDLIREALGYDKVIESVFISTDSKDNKSVKSLLKDGLEPEEIRTLLGVDNL